MTTNWQRVLPLRDPSRPRAAAAFARRSLRAAGGPRSASPAAASCVGGFSLIELIISLAILSVGLLGAMRVFPVGLRSSQRSEMSSKAAIAAQRTIESLKLRAWEELAEGESTAEEDGFEITTRIEPPQQTELVDAGRLKRIEVRVQWTQDNHARDVTVVTYLRKAT